MQSDARKQCWSCDNKPAQNGKRYRGCCKRCATDRRCATCETFCEEPTLPWCRLCEKRLARSCKSCFRPDVLAMEICTKCSSSSASVHKGTDYCWSCVAGGFSKKVIQGNIVQNTGIVADIVILIGFAKAAGALTQRRTPNGVRVVVCGSVHGAKIVILLLLWLRCFVALVLTGHPWCRQKLY